jgi:hypothetical protein
MVRVQPVGFVIRWGKIHREGNGRVTGCTHVAVWGGAVGWTASNQPICSMRFPNTVPLICTPTIRFWRWSTSCSGSNACMNTCLRRCVCPHPSRGALAEAEVTDGRVSQLLWGYGGGLGGHLYSQQSYTSACWGLLHIHPMCRIPSPSPSVHGREVRSSDVSEPRWSAHRDLPTYSALISPSVRSAPPLSLPQ